MTETVPLAEPSDVAAALGRDLTSDENIRVVPILAKASELFRRRSGQQFTPGASRVRLKVTAGRVTLVQRPVVSVESVTTDCDPSWPVQWTLEGSVLRIHPVRSGDFVVVSYTHGSDDVPELVRLTIADIARRVLTIDPAAVRGVSQTGTTTGPFSDQYTFAAWAVGGQTMLSPDDMAIADSFKVKTYGSIVQSAPTHHEPRWLL